MSLHAQLSQEAEARLQSQKRNSVITSVMIALLIMALVILILLFILLPNLIIKSPTIVAYQAGAPEEENMEQKEVNPQIQRKPSAPSSSMAKVIASSTPSPTAVPVPETEAQPNLDFGSGDDFGQGWGNGGDGGGGGFGNIPATMRKRCSPEDRLQRLKENGGNEKCEEAVVKALQYFKDTQAGDGSWGGGTKVAYTGLVLLAYLGHCETPLSVEFGVTVTGAITFLVDNCQKNKGRMASNLQDKHWSYSHAIAAYALAEAYTFCSQLSINLPNLKESVQSSVQWIIDNQNKSGGWEYSYDEAGDRGGDMSITAWQMQALKAGKHTGLEFRNMTRCIRDALKYCETCQAADGGFGYQGTRALGDGHSTLVGAGTLCFQQHKGAANSNARKGIKYIDKKSQFNYEAGPCNLYEHYYSSQAAINNGGKSWVQYNEMFRDQLLKAQNNDGSWPAPPQPGPAARNDSVYVTALATLMLEVYYRFLPGTAAGK
tara:strand:+ start:251 stop:1714 length:1464 start_codon:yes stop_codon:yes gene_type:complete